METNSLLKLIELDEKLTILEEEGEAIREPFNEMMKRKQERYSFLLSSENDPAIDSESVKVKIKGIKEFIEVFSGTLSNWDYSNERKREYYQKQKVSEILTLKNNPVTLCDLNQTDTIEEIITTMEDLLLIQVRMLSTLGSIVEAEQQYKEYFDSMKFDLN